MLTGQNWKSDAVVRLVLSVIICLCAGGLVGEAVNYSPVKGQSVWLFYLVGLAAMICLAVALRLVNSTWSEANILWRLAVTLTLFYAALLAGVWMHKRSGTPGPSPVQMIIGAASFQGAGLVLAAFFLRRHGVAWRDAFGFDNNRRASVVAGVILACAFLPVGWALQQASGYVIYHLPQFGLRPVEQESVQALRFAGTWGERTTLGLVTIGLAPAAEEVLFRGILYTWLSQAGFPRLALWGSSLLFALMHFNAVTFVPLLVLAVLLTLLYERTANLFAPIAAHSAFNGLNFGMLYLLGQ